MQLNAISRLQRFMGKEQKEALINSFIFSNFNYCPLVWHFCSCKSSQKIEKIQLRCLRIIYNDYSSDYQTLLNRSQKPSMEIKRLRNLALEMFKTINDLNPKFMKSIFSAKLNARVRPNDILVQACKSATFGDKSLATLGPKIWNALPQNIKAENCYKQIPKSSSAKLADRKKNFFFDTLHHTLYQDSRATIGANCRKSRA